jgi:hypothetical protein
MMNYKLHGTRYNVHVLGMTTTDKYVGIYNMANAKEGYR